MTSSDKRLKLLQKKGLIKGEIHDNKTSAKKRLQVIDKFERRNTTVIDENERVERSFDY